MQDPAVGFYFQVEFSGIEDLQGNDFRFQEVSGLNSEIGVEELQEGGENRFAHRLPNPARYSNLILKRGLVTETALIDWFRNAIENFEFDPITVKVALLNDSGEPMLNWNYVGAYPVRWSVSDLNARKNEVMIDTIELAYKYFTKSR